MICLSALADHQSVPETGKEIRTKEGRQFYEIYCMPSATHCSGIRMDYLEWLDTWCSEEKYPEETLYGVIEKTGGEMPMATFPDG